MLNLTRLLDAASNHAAYDQPILLNNNNSWAVTSLVVNGAVESGITIAWTDSPSSQGTHCNAVNNLNLIPQPASGLVIGRGSLGRRVSFTPDQLSGADRVR